MPRVGDGAVISDCKKYRYVLTRRVGTNSRTVVFIMLNPSWADAVKTDKTLDRCIGYARQWGYGRLTLLNLFAFRAQDKSQLKKVPDPIGPENETHFVNVLGAIVRNVDDDPLIVCAWGNDGILKNRDLIVFRWLKKRDFHPRALGLTTKGHPRHPSRARKDVELVPFSPPPRN